MHAGPYPEGVVLDACGRRRSPVTFSEYAKGKPSRNKGRKFPPKPPTVEQIVQFLQAVPSTPEGRRLRAIAVVGWRSGLRVAEICDLEESDLDRRNLAIVVRCGKGGKRRVSAMDEWGWGQLDPWLIERANYPIGPLFPVLSGPTKGRTLATSIVRTAFRKNTERAGLRIRVHAHSLRHAHAVELWREGVDIYTISRQLGHANPAVTVKYLQGLAPLELLEVIGKRRAPVMPLPSL